MERYVPALTRPAIVLLVFVLWQFSVTLVHGNLLVSTDGNYSVGAHGDGDYWLKSGPFFFYHNGTRLNTDNGTLQSPKSAFVRSGRDKLGQWQMTCWTLKGPDNITMVAGIKTYPLNEPNIVIFSQEFPNGLKNGRAPDANWTMTGFPMFRFEEGVTNTSLGYLQFAGYMMGDRSKTYGRWTPATADVKGGLDGSGPLVVFDQQGGVLLVSPMDNSMAASMWLHDGVLAWGVMGGVDTLNDGFRLQTLLYIGERGVGQAFSEWGRILRKWYGKTDDVTRQHQSRDITLTHLGYWTDNGAYYYYHPEDNKTFEQTLPDVIRYASQQRIPYRYVQIDSWWYPKDSLGAVTTWDAMPSVFPHGLKNLSHALNLPIAAHNRYWSVNTTYAKQNGGQFDFFIGHQLSLPTSQTFWNWLLETSSKWGLTLYEQDWLNVQLLGTELLQTNVTAGADWLDSMARAARANNMSVQYCMSQSRHALHSLRWPQVTQIRVTDDYHLYDQNWKIGVTSHFAAALGLAPSKDTFWTSSVEPGNLFNKTEPFPELQSAVATLSTGPVGPGDAINITDRENLMRCCAESGMILKPSRPATAIDAMFLEMGFGEGAGTSGEVWSTYTDFDDDMRFGIVFTANVTRSFKVTPTSVGFHYPVWKFPDSRVVVRNALHKPYPFSDTAPLDIGPDTCNTAVAPFFCLFYTSPVIHLRGNEVILLGETDKWVPMSAQRVRSLSTAHDALTLTLVGQAAERIRVSYLLNGQLANITETVPANASGVVTVRISPPRRTTTTAASDVTTDASAPTQTTQTSPGTTSTKRNTTSTNPWGGAGGLKSVPAALVTAVALLVGCLLRI